MMTRRKMLQTGILGATSLLLPGRRASAQYSTVAPFQVPLPIAPEMTPTTSRKGGGGSLMITQKEAYAQILPGAPPTKVWTYNGVYPGPTIRARRGQPLTVRHVNNLPDPTVVHLHGAHTPPASDGFPTDYIMPGSYLDYNGFLGNHFLVNGAITPYLATYRRKYRFRLLNGSNARVFGLGLKDGSKFTVIASDGGL